MLLLLRAGAHRGAGNWRFPLAYLVPLGARVVLERALLIWLPSGIFQLRPSGARPRKHFSTSQRASDVALQLINILYCFIGLSIGTLVGVLPGAYRPILAMSLLLPITLSGTPEFGIIMMAGIYYGSDVWRLDDPASGVIHPRRGRLGGDLHRRPSNGETGPRGPRSASRRWARSSPEVLAGSADAGGAVARQRRDRVRAGGIFSLMVLGLVVLTFLPRLDGQGAADGMHRHRAGPDRARQLTAQPRLTFGRMELIDGIGRCRW